MVKNSPVNVYGAVEGDMDEVVLRRLLNEKGFNIAGIYGRRGKDYLKQKVSRYNQAAVHNHWIVLVDLNSSADCAPGLVSEWLPRRSVHMHLRVVVRSIESWLLSDAERIAKFLNVPGKLIPSNPENLLNPKETLVNLARKSRSRDIKEDMVPRAGSGRNIGAAYNAKLIDFVTSDEYGWRPQVAARYSDSLKRCINAINKWSI